jgi:predicted P-loop ATPase/GTPase
VKITRNDLEFAKTCWGVYVSGDTAEIRAFKFSNSKKFKYLKKAMEYVLLRRPDAMGLSNIDRKILELIKENPLTVEEIVRELLSWQNTETWYGFGDLQYFSYIKRLKKYYYIKNDRYFLTDTGKSLIEKS